MIERIYFSLWGLFLLAATVTYAAGFMTMGVLTVFGFIMFGLIFMGIIGVLPFWTTHHGHPGH